ncbi:MAG: hypothetical protein R3275_03905 [Saprospiraceae bacterium]|nr:hypothetical protein [Saprospiraceae bacterium]
MNDSVIEDYRLNELKLRTSSNYKEFEDSLNQEYVDTFRIVVRPEIESFSFDVDTNGYISSTERSDIRDQIDGIILEQGRSPQIVDVNFLNQLIEVIFDNGESAIPPHFPEDIRPNGGINYDGSLTIGEWCDGTADPAGGGCGRVGRAFISSFSISQNVDYVKDIREFAISSECNDDIYDRWDGFGLLEISDDDFWLYSTSQCPAKNHPLCLSSTDMQNYYDLAHDIVDNNLPEGYDIVGFHSAKYFTNFDNKWWWYYYLKAAKVVETTN